MKSTAKKKRTTLTARAKRHPKNARMARQAIAAREMAQKCLEMRVQGHTYARIAEKHGITIPTVSHYINDLLDERAEQTKQTVEQLRDIELARLNGLIVKHYRTSAHPDSAAIVIRCGERISKLCGLDVNKLDLNVNGVVAMTHSQLDISKLNDEQLGWLEIILSIAGPQAQSADDSSVVATQTKTIEDQR